MKEEPKTLPAPVSPETLRIIEILIDFGISEQNCAQVLFIIFANFLKLFSIDFYIIFENLTCFSTKLPTADHRPDLGILGFINILMLHYCSCKVKIKIYLVI